MAENAPAAAAFDVEAVRAEFPGLAQRVNGHPLVYLDSAATAQKPRAVLAALERYYREDCANIHRSAHQLSERATAAYEGARRRVRDFIGAGSESEIVFTRGTTDSINLVAASYGQRLRAGDEVLITGLEHHSNIVPWQLLCERSGARLVVAPIDDRGEVPLDEFERRLSPRTKIVAAAHISNALGTINPVAEFARRAHERGAVLVVDGAQSAPHLPIDVRELGCDFFAFSGHKLFGPTGIGVLYGRAELLDAMPPYQGGGDMIRSVTFEKTTYNDLPYKFEAGTPHVAGAIGLGAAVEYLTALDMAAVATYEHELTEYGLAVFRRLRGVRLIGPTRRRAGVFSFVVEGVHPHDAGTVLDAAGIAVRAGHHCAQPVMERFGVPATTRASLALYNTRAEIDALAEGIGRVQAMFRV
ncbi:MAG: cysteine desulfurase [Terriglobales bacterium]